MPEPLAHAEREACRPACRRRRRARPGRDLVDPAPGDAVGGGEHPQVVVARTGRCGSTGPPAAHRPRAAAPAGPVAPSVDRSPLPAVGRSRPSIIRIVVDLPAPFGPRKPVTIPGWTENVTWSTTVVPVYALVKPSAWITSVPPATEQFEHQNFLSVTTLTGLSTTGAIVDKWESAVEAGGQAPNPAGTRPGDDSVSLRGARRTGADGAGRSTSPDLGGCQAGSRVFVRGWSCQPRHDGGAGRGECAQRRPDGTSTGRRS